MFSIQDIELDAIRLGQSYFSKEDFFEISSQITKRVKKINSYVVSIAQDNNNIQLSVGLFDDTALYDFTYQSKNLYISRIYLNRIETIEETINKIDNSLFVQITATGKAHIYYTAYGKESMDMLLSYVSDINTKIVAL